jgi:uncharacterized membrane protein
MILLRSLVRFFLAGVFTILPLVVTIAVVMWVADLVDKWLGPDTALGRAATSLGAQFASGDTFAYLTGWVLVLAVIFGLGVLVELGARRLVQERIDTLAARVPLLGGVYGTVRQLVGMMDKKSAAEMHGMSVVFCIFGQESGAAFLALLPTPEVFRIGEVDYYAVLIPTAPVPVGGSLLFVPVRAVKPAGISVDAFMSIYVSMGVTGPQFLEAAPTLEALRRLQAEDGK